MTFAPAGAGGLLRMERPLVTRADRCAPITEPLGSKGLRTLMR